jgi:hypothetical protein
MNDDRTGAGGPRVLSVAELLAEAGERRTLPIDDPRHPDGFEIDEAAGTVDIYWPQYCYWIHLSRIATPEALLGWVHHLGEKNWPHMTPQRIARLVEVIAVRNGWSIFGM